MQAFAVEQIATIHILIMVVSILESPIASARALEGMLGRVQIGIMYLMQDALALIAKANWPSIRGYLLR